MKVAIVTNSFPYCRLELFEKLAQQKGYQITIFKYANWWDADAEGIEIKRWQAIGFKLPLLKDDIYLHFDCRVLKAIWKGDWDIIIAYGYGSFTTWLVAGIAKVRRIPFVLWSDARLEYEISRSSMTSRLKHLLHRMTTSFIASGTSTRLFFEHMGISPDKITIIPYAINNQVLSEKCKFWRKRAAITRAELGISKSSIVILYVGRLVKEKGVGELLEACTSPDVRTACTLLLVGGGRDEQYFKSLAGKNMMANTIFTGKIAHEFVAKYYAIADIFVLPSYKDVWGLVINEAMVCGLPIITTSEVGAWRDLVHDGINGFVVPAHNVEKLRWALCSLINSVPLRYRMSKKSLEIISSWDMKLGLDRLSFLLSQAAR